MEKSKVKKTRVALYGFFDFTSKNPTVFAQLFSTLVLKIDENSLNAKANINKNSDGIDSIVVSQNSDLRVEFGRGSIVFTKLNSNAKHFDDLNAFVSTILNIVDMVYKVSFAQISIAYDGVNDSLDSAFISKGANCISLDRGFCENDGWYLSFKKAFNLDCQDFDKASCTIGVGSGTMPNTNKKVLVFQLFYSTDINNREARYSNEQVLNFIDATIDAFSQDLMNLCNAWTYQYGL